MTFLIAPLRAHAPFDEMEVGALQFLTAKLQLAYYPRGQVIIGPDSGIAGRLYIVKQGRVPRRRSGFLRSATCWDGWQPRRPASTFPSSR